MKASKDDLIKLESLIEKNSPFMHYNSLSKLLTVKMGYTVSAQRVRRIAERLQVN